MKFQQENEEFTQWKEEEEKRVEEKVETPTAPTSFADALLRKLTIKEEKAQPKGVYPSHLCCRTADFAKLHQSLGLSLAIMNKSRHGKFRKFQRFPRRESTKL